MPSAPWFPLVTAAAGMLKYVGLPAILFSVICGGGLVMLLCGVAVARRDGCRASRGRCLWRSLVTGSPWLAGPVVLAILRLLIGIVWAAIAAGGSVIGLAFVSPWLPERGLHDPIAGTSQVPRQGGLCFWLGRVEV